ncbi:MAG: hypothetical protein WBM24_18735, partial [Candidatus Sulfotelmatobacter sp.]
IPPSPPVLFLAGSCGLIPNQIEAINRGPCGCLVLKPERVGDAPELPGTRTMPPPTRCMLFDF